MNILKYYHENRIGIWITIIAIIIIIIAIQTINGIIKNNNGVKSNNLSNQNDIIKEQDYKNNLNPNILISDTEVVKEKQLIIDQFIRYCNTGKIQKAYDLLSDNCKKQLFPTLEIFKQNYYNINGVQVRNETSYQLTDEILKPDIQVNNENILIFHTHTCESYTPSENYIYQQSGTYRTTDLNYNVARVGTELEKQLNSYGYKVLHDKTYHDYPAYNGSYGRSLTTVKSLLEHNKNTDVVIDIHRDAIGDYSYAPTVQIGEEQAAQLMFVIGTDGGGLEHNNWNENLKFAIKVQEKANELYPGLFKPIILRNSRYNQHLAKGASIIEVGATGNTLPQCLNSMKYLAKVINEVMK